MKTDGDAAFELADVLDARPRQVTNVVSQTIDACPPPCNTQFYLIPEDFKPLFMAQFAGQKDVNIRNDKLFFITVKYSGSGENKMVYFMHKLKGYA
jgi:hypothetical protein